MNKYKALILLDITFLALFAVVIAALYTLDRIPRTISTMDLILLGLAAARLADIISTDEVTEWLRKPFVQMEAGEIAGKEVQVREGRGDGLRKVIGDLLACPWCVAVWAAAGLTYLYFLIPNIAWLFILVLAVAEIGSILQTLSTILVRIEKYFKGLGVPEEGL